MAEVRALKALLSKAAKGESFYLRLSDGHCRGAELTWLPHFEQWVYVDNDSANVGWTESLTLIFSSADGDESGLNRAAGLITAELDGNTGLWVTDCDPSELDNLPDDAEVFTLGDPSLGLVDVELIDAN